MEAHLSPFNLGSIPSHVQRSCFKTNGKLLPCTRQKFPLPCCANEEEEKYRKRYCFFFFYPFSPV